MPNLVEHLKEIEVLRSPSVIEALEHVDRADFVPEKYKHLAYEDMALPLLRGQTISQPYTVVFMLEHLRVKRGDFVLEIGYGSGWQTVLLAYLVGERGRVYAFEIVKDLCAMGKENFKKYPSLNSRIETFCMTGKFGHEQAAPFDRIVAAAEVHETPYMWRQQLVKGGRMVYPQDGALVLEIKKEKHAFMIRKFPGFVFVPFVERSTL